VTKHSRVLVLSHERIEKLLIWLGVWRMGAAVGPLNIEANTKQLVRLRSALNPALILYHRDVDVDALVNEQCRASRIRFGTWSPHRATDAEDHFFRLLPRGSEPADVPERNNPDDVACLFSTSGTTARPKVVIYNHATYWMNGVTTLPPKMRTPHLAQEAGFQMPRSPQSRD
jgi:acyl-CoA synthetase (AMP-forming)/AMP-acid ligase II